MRDAQLKFFIYELLKKLGGLKTGSYLFLIVVLYSLNSLQPFLISSIISSSYTPVLLSGVLIFSFFAVGFIEKLNSFYIQKIRKESKNVLWNYVLSRETDFFRN